VTGALESASKCTERAVSLATSYDIVDVAQPGQRAALINPVVVALTEGTTPPPIPAN
jgi:hypothetical protein